MQEVQFVVDGEFRRLVGRCRDWESAPDEIAASEPSWRPPDRRDPHRRRNHRVAVSALQLRVVSECVASRATIGDQAAQAAQHLQQGGAAPQTCRVLSFGMAGWVPIRVVTHAELLNGGSLDE